AAADAVPEIARYQPFALEGLDDRLIELEHMEHLAEDAIQQLPRGSGWLMVQFAGKDADEVERRARQLAEDLRTGGDGPTVAFLDDPRREDELWKAREAGLGATAFPPAERETHEGWEDAAIPPDRLGDYLRDFRALLERYGYASAS